MYLDTYDFMTVWKLAHNWSGENPDTSDPENLSEETKEAIYRILNTIGWNRLSVRTRSRLIMDDDSVLTFILDWRHHLRFLRCLKSGNFDKAYLDSIYVKRPEVISWCEKEYLPIPPFWQKKQNDRNPVLENEETDNPEEGWYAELTDRRKKRVACLELAKLLWKANPNQTYEQIFNHSTMKTYGNPNVFSFNSFKRWASSFAPEHAKKGGRPLENKYL